jgi:hypothetical protein
MASNRPGGQGGLDIWAAYRDSADDPFGAPVNLGSPINTAADEFCPTPLTNGMRCCSSARKQVAAAARTSTLRVNIQRKAGRRRSISVAL